MKAIIFDSGCLISLAMNGLLPELRELKKIFDGVFLITKEVKYETIDKPLTIKRFEFEAMRLKSLLDDKIVEMPESVGVSDDEISKEARKILDIANNTFFQKSKAIEIIHNGEASILALSRILNSKKIKNIIAVDERTTRVLGEKPDNLKKLLGKKFHTTITARSENYKHFSEFKFIRSTELMYVAHKKGVLRVKDKNVLDAVLYALKFKGAAISGEEIEEIERM